MIDFKGMHFPKDVILFAVFFYLRYPVSYRDLEEIMEERGESGERSADQINMSRENEREEEASIMWPSASQNGNSRKQEPAPFV